MLDKKDLLELYKIAIEEYRFEVTLNWERTKYFFVLDIGIITIATGLLKAGAHENGISFLISLIFLIGVITSFLGISSIKQSRIYYHRTVYKKTLIERELGMFNLKSEYDDMPIDITIATTQGMDKKHEILKNPNKYLEKKHYRRGTVMHNMTLALYLLSVLNFFGLFYSSHGFVSDIINSICRCS